MEKHFLKVISATEISSWLKLISTILKILSCVYKEIAHLHQFILSLYHSLSLSQQELDCFVVSRRKRLVFTNSMLVYLRQQDFLTLSIVFLQLSTTCCNVLWNNSLSDSLIEPSCPFQTYQIKFTRASLLCRKN